MFNLACRIGEIVPYSVLPQIIIFLSYIQIQYEHIINSRYPNVHNDQNIRIMTFIVNLQYFEARYKTKIKNIVLGKIVIQQNRQQIIQLTTQKEYMKPTTIMTPALQQLYSQRHQYEQHKQKLMKIYKDRKSQLGHDTHRTTSFEGIKEIRSRSFIHKFNEQNAAIARQNQRFAGKLQSVRPSVRRSVSEQRHRSTHSYITPFLKSRLIDTEKQNHRISERMKNMASSLNQKNFVKDYAKSQKIKNRLMKYSAEDSRVYLKSQRYLNQNEENQSVISNQKARPLKIKEQSQIYREQNTEKNKLKKPIISHYRREEITKNKIDTATSSLAGIKAKAKDRPNTSLQLQKTGNETNFFTTQPNRQKKIGAKKVFI